MFDLPSGNDGFHDRNDTHENVKSVCVTCCIKEG